MQDACRPAARATATCAAVFHSYNPPPCTYASTSPQITAATLAPADPRGTNSALIRPEIFRTKPGGLLRLTTMRIRPGAPSPGALPPGALSPGSPGGGSSVDATPGSSPSLTSPVSPAEGP